MYLFNYLFYSLFVRAIFYLCLLLFGFRQSNDTCIILFCRLYYLDTPPFWGLREFACTILRSCSKLPFVRSPNIPLYSNLDWLIINTIVLNCYDFIEESCILRCHLDSHPEGFSWFRRSFIVCSCCAAASGTYVHYHEGTIPCIFNIYGCFFYF